MNLFRTMRRQYYYDLQGLRNLLKTAREAQELRENGGYLDPRKQAKVERMEQVVSNREVNYFNVLDIVDPDFKDILIQECRKFHRELILENAALADQLATLGVGTLTLDEKLRMFVAEYEIADIILKLAQFAPGDHAPAAVKRRYQVCVLNAAGIQDEAKAEEVIDRYINRVAGADADNADPTQSAPYRELKEKYDETEEKLSDAKIEIDDLKARLADDGDMKDAELAALRDELNTARSEAANAQTSARGGSAELEAMRLKLAEAEKSLETARGEIQEKESQMQAISAQNSHVEDLSGPLSAAQSRISELEEEIAGYKSGSVVSESVREQHEEERARMQAELDAAREAAEKEAAELREEVERAASLAASNAANSMSSVPTSMAEEDPEWQKIKDKYGDQANCPFIDGLVEERDRAQSELSQQSADLDYYKGEYDKMNEEALNMSAEVERMKSEVENATTLLAVQHPTESGGDNDGKAARNAMKSTSESEVERQQATIDRGDLVITRAALGDPTDPIPERTYAVVKKRLNANTIVCRFAHGTCPLEDAPQKGLKLKAKKGTFLSIPGAPDNFADLCVDDADEVARELGEPVPSRRGSPRGPLVRGSSIDFDLAPEQKEPPKPARNMSRSSSIECAVPGKKVVEVTDNDYDALTGRTVASFRYFLEFF
ncbi:unnamed protein product [Amoebophrya sp. A25]|nr:unnamed protein product [Amoebophrya sp. A25]|eukprot:GSA25T00010760001.1